MSKADEMFEKLGFKKVKDTDTELIYKLEEYLMGDKCIHQIMFAKIGKIIFSYREKTGEPMGIGIEELQAINEKVKELGWNE